MIYYLHEQGTNHVKIGYTKDGNSLVSRIKSLQTGNSHAISLLGVQEGGFEEETKLHVRFKQYHVRGEWFRIEGELDCYLDRLGVLTSCVQRCKSVDQKVQNIAPNLSYYDADIVAMRIGKWRDADRFTRQHIEREAHPNITDDNWHVLWMVNLEQRTGLTMEEAA